MGPEDATEIALWDGTLLEESHRHHSHLAAICPFDTVDLNDEVWRGIVNRSLRRWVSEGMGKWSGWCVPWASMLQSRCANGEMAELLLTIWETVFTNEGRGTLHDCDFPGFTLMGAGGSPGDSRTRNEIMQLDAGFGAIVAIQDMLLHTRRGVHYVFAGVPRSWRDCAFDGMLTEGGFLMSATRSARQTTQVKIHAQHDGVFRLANPWPVPAPAGLPPEAEHLLEGTVLELTMKAGEAITLTPPD